MCPVLLDQSGEAWAGGASEGVAVFVMASGCGWGGLVGRGVPRHFGESRGKPRPTISRAHDRLKGMIFRKSRSPDKKKIVIAKVRQRYHPVILFN